jgi:hypothetical protein
MQSILGVGYCERAKPRYLRVKLSQAKELRQDLDCASRLSVTRSVPMRGSAGSTVRITILDW